MQYVCYLSLIRWIAIYPFEKRFLPLIQLAPGEYGDMVLLLRKLNIAFRGFSPWSCARHVYVKIWGEVVVLVVVKQFRLFMVLGPFKINLRKSARNHFNFIQRLRTSRRKWKDKRTWTQPKYGLYPGTLNLNWVLNTFHPYTMNWLGNL